MRPISHKFIAAIESSCDDTCISIINNCHKILYSNIISQKNIHRPFGGVVPQLAAQGHRNSFQKLLYFGSCKNILSPFIKCVAVTAGPGIGNCLNAGFEFGKHLASFHKVPLLPVNHLVNII
jgi:N6-L-threonylcarbamoyladenine synthase